MNAVVLSHAHVGPETIIGACALVGEHKVIPGGVLAVGVPTKVMRNLTEAEHHHVLTSAANYCQRALEHIESH